MEPSATIYGSVIHKTKLLYQSIRFEHTLFALPFAYIGMFLASVGFPELSQFLWITVAMVAARTLAMSSNRLIHMREDAANPRTAKRHMPLGIIKPWEMGVLLVVTTCLFFVAASQLNTLALILAPIAAVVVILYSFAKYYTWTTHFVLGWADAIAPVGGWVGVSGTLEPEAVLLAFAVSTWIGGFDILYACQDRDFDIKYGVHSIPQRFGIPFAFWVYRISHLMTSICLLGVGIWMSLGLLFYIGWFIASCLLIYQQTIVGPKDLSRLNAAFFNVNSYISLTLLLFTTLDVAL